MKTHLSTPTITFEAAHRAVQCVMDAASAIGVRAVATVADPSLTIVAVGKGDGAPPHSLETSRRKAFTAASTRRASADLPAQLHVALEHGSGGILTGIAGGVPIVFDGTHVGGLGVAGGTPAQDAEIAAAALAALDAFIAADPGATSEGAQA